MNKTIIHKIFLAVGMIICLVPFVGMIIIPTKTTTENRTLSSAPKLIEKNAWNPEFLSNLGTYFEDHFALRNEMITADSMIQSKVFDTSTVSTVIKGTDGWLYYSDSLDNYLGQNTLSDRGAYNVAHNIALIQKRMEQEKRQFFFTVAPNKNSLYGDHMPYYDSTKVSVTNNMDCIAPWLTQQKVHYIDLYQIFRESQDIMYRKQDSHWNGKGAVLAYNTIMDGMNKEHYDYSTTPILRTKTSIGDLATALYSKGAKPEWDSKYQYKINYQFTNNEKNWEEPWIQTSTEKGMGNLLMFRDSFGNTLSPLIADEYANASFSKNTVYLLDSYIDTCKPDTVLAEIVERNIQNFALFDITKQNKSGPPVMQGPEVKVDCQDAKVEDKGVTVKIGTSDLQPDYQMISGIVDPGLLDTNSDIYVEVTTQEQTHVYEAYSVSKLKKNDSYEDNGYLLYLPSSQIDMGNVTIRIIVETKGNFIVTEQRQVKE